PYRDIPDFNGYLTELQRMGFIDRYSVKGVAIIQVVNFAKHQSPHKTEKASELPERPEMTDSCDITVNPPLNDEAQTVKESLIPDSLIPDSPSLNPDIPNPDSSSQPPAGCDEAPPSPPAKPVHQKPKSE